MSDDPDIVNSWTLYRGSEPSGMPRFHLRAEVKAEFVEPTRDEVRTALAQILDEALGPDTDTLSEIVGWTGPAADENELGRLRAWKAEALPLLEILDRCHDALPGHAQAPLGHSKAQAVYDYIHDKE